MKLSIEDDSRQVLPSYATADYGDSRARYSELFTQFHSGESASSNLYNVGFLQHAIPVSLSVSVPPFINFIGHVCFWSSKEQMIGIYANRVIAFVKHKHTIGDTSEMKNPRKTVSACLNNIVFGSCAADVNQPVSGLTDSSYPFPAPRGLLDLAPESFIGRSRNRHSYIVNVTYQDGQGNSLEGTL